MKKYNFGAGPSILPQEVMKATAEACVDFNGIGLSLMEMSHRSKEFQAVIDEARDLMKELLGIPDEYSVLFLGGGASLEFCMIPYNFLEKSSLCKYRCMGNKSSKRGEVVWRCCGSCVIKG